MPRAAGPLHHQTPRWIQLDFLPAADSVPTVLAPCTKRKYESEASATSTRCCCPVQAHQVMLGKLDRTQNSEVGNYMTRGALRVRSGVIHRRKQAQMIRRGLTMATCIFRLVALSFLWIESWKGRKSQLLLILRAVYTTLCPPMDNSLENAPDSSQHVQVLTYPAALN